MNRNDSIFGVTRMEIHPPRQLEGGSWVQTIEIVGEHEGVYNSVTLHSETPIVLQHMAGEN